MSIEEHFQNKFDFSFLGKINDDEGGFPCPHWSEDKLPTFLYSAEFSRARKHLSISASRMKDPELVYESKNIEGPDAWKLFYMCATFEDILDSIDLTPWLEVVGKKKEFSQYKESFKGEIRGDTVVYRMRPSVKAVWAKGGTLPNPQRETKLALEVIRDNPTSLLDKEYAHEVISLLNEARYSLDEEKANNALKLLSDHFMPKRRSVLKPSNIKAVKEIMGRLARHLSHMCKEMLSYDLEKGEKITREVYEELIKMAHKEGELRISRLSINDLNSLINTPIKYSDGLLKKHFNNVCLKTLTG